MQIGTLLILLLVLACPLMMLFMHRGGHGSHVEQSHDRGDSGIAGEPPAALDELRRSDSTAILLDPGGEPFRQATAEALAMGKCSGVSSSVSASSAWMRLRERSGNARTRARSRRSGFRSWSVSRAPRNAEVWMTSFAIVGPKDMPPAMKWTDGNDWHYAKTFGQAAPDLIIKSPKYTQKGGAMDAWYKPVVDTGVTEPRWVRAIEIRPGSIKGRKITHHALAYLLQDHSEADLLLNLHT